MAVHGREAYVAEIVAAWVPLAVFLVSRGEGAAEVLPVACRSNRKMAIGQLCMCSYDRGRQVVLFP